MIGNELIEDAAHTSTSMRSERARHGGGRDHNEETTDLISLQRLALLATGRTGADIERLIREVRQKARREQRPITWSDLETALLSERRQMTPEHRYRIAVHEVGHALAYTMLGIGEVQTLAVGVSLDGTAGGLGQVVVTFRTDEPQTENWLTRKMACLLAGRVAEQLIFGAVLAGSGGHPESDLARATTDALSAETELGFSDVETLIYRRPALAEQQMLQDNDLMKRVEARLKWAEAVALGVLETHKAFLEAMARELAELGVMTGDHMIQRLAQFVVVSGARSRERPVTASDSAILSGATPIPVSRSALRGSIFAIPSSRKVLLNKETASLKAGLPFPKADQTIPGQTA
ncbi:hypothetical protein FE840_000665 [Peteryoungia desertarenae]|uniref:Peptidase M41 domain-containing protein n=1 Tax=Peteryoungia desertarenae TaxID=1813451 RepID=A0ABX6QIK5_9HYPH|nr:hypothetical protein [Peteryoungia desertarenae]QLF68191.1 hypothetical protein FE840_000665 [Peteryoungia desertarenae]